MKRKPKPKPKRTAKAHEPRRHFENGYPGYVSPATREFARQMYERINCK